MNRHEQELLAAYRALENDDARNTECTCFYRRPALLFNRKCIQKCDDNYDCFWRERFNKDIFKQ